MNDFPIMQILTETFDPRPRFKVVHRRCLGVSLGWQCIKIENGEENEIGPIREDQRDAEEDLRNALENVGEG